MPEEQVAAARTGLHLINPLRSIVTRIFAGFLLVLLIFAGVAVLVRRAGDDVGQSLRSDAVSQAEDAHLRDVQVALLEARLRMAAYVQTEGIAERDNLAVAIDRLQRLAETPDGEPGEGLGRIGTTIHPVRTALANAAEAIADRRAAAAALVAASAAASNSGTALAETTARLGDKVLAEAGAALMADIARGAVVAMRATATDNRIELDAVADTIAHASEILAAIDEASLGSPRLRRLVAGAQSALDAMHAALAQVRSTGIARGERLAELGTAAARATAIAEEAVQSVARDQTIRRTRTMEAAGSLQATVVWTAAGASVLGLTIALALGFSITRPLGRLARAMAGLAEGSLDTTVPGTAARDEVGAMAGAVLILKDRSAHLATHDVLTDLPNRSLFQERLALALAWSRRNDGSLAVFYIDLDRFKDINDALGHAVGDQLLVQVAARLRGCLRETDTLARLGGDEFAILQVAVRHPANIEMLAQRIIEGLSVAFDVDGHSVTVGASVGIALRSAADLRLLTVDAGMLMQEADVALYRAKEEGRGVYRFFAADMNLQVLQRHALEDDLREALENHQFRLHYQPQFDLAEQRIVGAEALVRWRHPVRGEVSPSEFIPLAEQTGLIVQIGEWVMHEACRQAAEWPELSCMAVNVSPVQFRRPGFVDLVRHALQEATLAPERLEVEITEGVLLTETPETLTILQQLRALGIAIAMDDFGTGYSSLGYLQKFRFDKIKIDQSFVGRLGKDRQAGEIVRAILRMSHAMGIRVNAEGVEQPGQMQLLRDEGCDEVQGYLFGRPVSADEFTTLLERRVAVA